MRSTRSLWRTQGLVLETAWREATGWILGACAGGLVFVHRSLLPRFPEGGSGGTNVADAWLLPLLLGGTALSLAREQDLNHLARPLPEPAKHAFSMLRQACLLGVAATGMALGAIWSGEQVDLLAALEGIALTCLATGLLPGRAVDPVSRWILAAAVLLASPGLERAGVPPAAQIAICAALGLLGRSSTRA